MTAQKYRTGRRGLEADSASGALSPASVLVAQRVARFYQDALPAHAGGRLADLGCGTRPLRPLYEPLATSTIAIDWPTSPHEVQLDLFADLCAGIPLRTAMADTLLASDVLEHLPFPHAFLDECHRVLRPGGVLIGNVPFLYWLHEEPHDYFRYTEHGLRHLTSVAGFSRIDIFVLGGGLDVVIDILGKISAKVPVAGPTMSRALQTAWATATSTGPVRRLFSSLERKFPLSYGFVAHR